MKVQSLLLQLFVVLEITWSSSSHSCWAFVSNNNPSLSSSRRRHHGSTTTTTTTTTTTQQQPKVVLQANSDNDDDEDDDDDNENALRQLGVVLGSMTKDQEEDVDSDEYAFRQQQAERQEKIQKAMQEQDLQWKDSMKKERWGDYAQAKTSEELLQTERKERDAVAQENQIKLRLAKESGINMDFLDAKEEEDVFALTKESTKTLLQRKMKASSSSSWFEELEDDLEEEWKETFMGDNNNNNKTTSSAEQVANVLTKDKQTGKVMTREKARGIRVGSAGGWTLEVFPGDFVVHRKYGIGRYDQTVVRPKTKLNPEEKAKQEERRSELTKIWLKEEMGGRCAPAELQEFHSKFGTQNDTDPISNPQTTVLEIAYQDGTVHVPIDRAYRLSRYRAGDSPIKPRSLSKVRGEQWRNAKKKVQENTLQLAQDVLALYATRETLERPPFDPALEPQVQEFAKTFPYTPTEDQISCFDAVANDMIWRSRPMDRLICGDVGFGKTEVALRAIYRAVCNGRQAAFLAPTGVLAAQHFKNTVARFDAMGMPGVVGLLRGGMSKKTKAGRETREAIAEGKFQVIIGTHALLGKDVKFSDLGLLVIDEEQRFGVKQKERLKLIAEGVDVLTMSATPIPRTLQMSLSGIRDTSTLQSPPPMRKPTKTVVAELNDDILLEAIGKELERGGQCYYVVPRISMMDEAEEEICRLFPGISIITAHGRMGKNQAEENVAAFAEGNKYQVLLATTVIENGVDIPTVNTIILQSAQRFGMSTLYQLRGRVGRSDVQAYSYFLHGGEASVTEPAAMRLQAIGDLTSLGSGMDVANRDLEIRGAGSLLGTEQSGMAAKVGFDLYMRMLKRSIRQLKGLDIPFVPRTNVLVPDLKASESDIIPASYIADDTVRYQEETQGRLAESTVALVNITNTWKAEYGGKLPASLQTNLRKMHLQASCRRLGVDVVGTLLVDDNSDDNDGNLYLRSPGLRPRHMQQIVSLLGGAKKIPKGIEVVFPSRMTNRNNNGDDDDNVNVNDDDDAKKKNAFDLKSLLLDETLGDAVFNSDDNDENDEDDWDAVDQEEAAAMKEMASAMQITQLTPDLLEDHPHFVISNFMKTPNTNKNQRVTLLLQLLLPLAKVVYEQQEVDKRQAQLAAELRDRRVLAKEKQKKLKKDTDARMGYNNYGGMGTSRNPELMGYAASELNNLASSEDSNLAQAFAGRDDAPPLR